MAANDVEANMFGSGSNNTDDSDADARSKKTRKDNPYGADIPPEDIAKMKSYHLGLRVSYALASILVITAAILDLQDTPVFWRCLLCLYVIAFSLLMFGFNCSGQLLAHSWLRTLAFSTQSSGGGSSYYSWGS